MATGTAYQDYLSTVWNVIPKVSYVTGSHNFKAGVNLEWGDDRNYIDNHRAISTLTLQQLTAARVAGDLGDGPQHARRALQRADGRLRLLRPGPLGHRSCVAVRRLPLRLVQRRLAG